MLTADSTSSGASTIALSVSVLLMVFGAAYITEDEDIGGVLFRPLRNKLQPLRLHP